MPIRTRRGQVLKDSTLTGAAFGLKLGVTFLVVLVCLALLLFPINPLVSAGAVYAIAIYSLPLLGGAVLIGLLLGLPLGLLLGLQYPKDLLASDELPEEELKASRARLGSLIGKVVFVILGLGFGGLAATYGVRTYQWNKKWPPEKLALVKRLASSTGSTEDEKALEPADSRYVVHLGLQRGKEEISKDPLNPEQLLRAIFGLRDEQVFHESLINWFRDPKLCRDLSQEARRGLILQLLAEDDEKLAPLSHALGLRALLLPSYNPLNPAEYELEISLRKLAGASRQGAPVGAEGSLQERAQRRLRAWLALTKTIEKQRLCDVAARALVALDPSLSFDPRGDEAARDAQIKALQAAK